VADNWVKDQNSGIQKKGHKEKKISWYRNWPVVLNE